MFVWLLMHLKSRPESDSIESCVDSEVAHSSVLMVQRLSYRRFLGNSSKLLNLKLKTCSVLELCKLNKHVPCLDSTCAKECAAPSFCM